MPQPNGHHRWVKPGLRKRIRRGDIQSCQHCGQKRKAILVNPPPQSLIARFYPGRQIWVNHFEVGGEWVVKRPRCTATPKTRAWKITSNKIIDDGLATASKYKAIAERLAKDGEARLPDVLSEWQAAMANALAEIERQADEPKRKAKR